MSNVLKKASVNGMTTIALPAIGTGILDYPPRIVAKIMIDEITKFSKENSQTSVKEITIVLYEKDTRTIAVSYFFLLISIISYFIYSCKKMITFCAFEHVLNIERVQ